ncbi:HTH_Tnp_Tc3_2 domain-containing protein [Trichonephila clavipes]|nr:HTH_Tnp_Tc3_2 domain-containing protein [Trichonephila clavipes]
MIGFSAHSDKADAVVAIPPVKSRNAYKHVSDFNKGRIVTYRNCGLSYPSIAAHVGRDPMTIRKIWNGWVQDRNTERRADLNGPLSLAAKKTGMIPAWS